MTLTEEEAKTKRCQESFGDHSVSPYGYSFSVPEPMHSVGVSMVATTSPSMCIGSGCMAWRWERILNPDLVEGNTVRADVATWIDSDKGYCGKAGNP